MPYRKNNLVEGNIYHVFTKSIAGFKIFNSKYDYIRMRNTMLFYVMNNSGCKFSYFLRGKDQNDMNIFMSRNHDKKIVQVLAYCLMPTHIHLVIKQFDKNGISRFLGLALQSYSRYFNLKYKRKGPLWEGRFKNVLVETDAQFLHLTRYVHLNPVSASLIDRPQDWEYSSYKEYLGLVDEDKRVCSFSEYLDMDRDAYKSFTDDQIDYQREVEQIKHLIVE